MLSKINKYLIDFKIEENGDEVLIKEGTPGINEAFAVSIMDQNCFFILLRPHVSPKDADSRFCVTLSRSRDWFMANKLIYWIPIVGVFVTLVNFEKDNGMGVGWCYYQAATLIIFIWIMAFLQYGK